MASMDAIDRWLPLLVRGMQVPLAARETQNLAYSISCWNERRTVCFGQAVFLHNFTSAGSCSAAVQTESGCSRSIPGTFVAESKIG